MVKKIFEIYIYMYIFVFFTYIDELRYDIFFNIHLYFHPNRSSFIPVNLIHLPLARPMVLYVCLIYHRPQKMMPFHGPLMQNRPWWVLGSYCYTLLQAKIMDFTIWNISLQKFCLIIGLTQIAFRTEPKTFLMFSIIIALFQKKISEKGLFIWFQY